MLIGQDVLEKIPWIIMIPMDLLKKTVHHQFGFEKYFSIIVGVFNSGGAGLKNLTSKGPP